jgi:hypothetical protein
LDVNWDPDEYLTFKREHEKLISISEECKLGIKQGPPQLCSPQDWPAGVAQPPAANPKSKEWNVRDEAKERFRRLAEQTLASVLS